MAGANIDPKMASFWDLLVPLPTSGANRVNLLGDPMRSENDLQRIVQIMTGGTYPFPTDSADINTNVAYANLFGSEFRPPSISPGRGHAIGNEYRPFTEPELQTYTKLRGQYFKEELAGLGSTTDKAAVRGAFQRANSRALAELGVSQPTSDAKSPRGEAAAGQGAGVQRELPRLRTPSRRGYGSLRLSSGRRSLRLGRGRVSGRSLRLRSPRLRIGRGLRLPTRRGSLRGSLRLRRPSGRSLRRRSYA